MRHGLSLYVRSTASWILPDSAQHQLTCQLRIAWNTGLGRNPEFFANQAAKNIE